MSYVAQAAESLLIDIEWIDRCPVLEPLRAFPEYAAAREKVAERAAAIWVI